MVRQKDFTLPNYITLTWSYHFLRHSTCSVAVLLPILFPILPILLLFAHHRYCTLNASPKAT